MKKIKKKKLSKTDGMRPLHTETEIEKAVKEIADNPEFKKKMKKAFNDLIIYGECRIDYGNGA